MSSGLENTIWVNSQLLIKNDLSKIFGAMTMTKLRQRMFIIPLIAIQLLAALLMLAELNMSEYRELFQNDGEMGKTTTR